MKRLFTFLLALLLTWIGASAQSSWTAPVLQSSTLSTEGGKYYLYNTVAKQYACMGNYYWGTNAIFGDNGLLFTLASASTTDYDGSSVDAYTLTSSNGQLFWDGSYLYCDGSGKTDIYFVFTETSTGSKVYKIHGTYAAIGTYIGYDPDDPNPKNYGTYGVLPDLTGTDGQGIEWELYAEDAEELYDALVILYNTLVHAESYGMTDSDEAYKSAGEVYLSSDATADDVMAAVAALEIAMEEYASEDDPDDVTYAYITNPSFDTGNLNGWTNTGSMSYQGSSYTNGDVTIASFAEKWTESANSLGDAKLSQTLADLPVGTYRLEADAIAVKQTTESPEVTGVYLYASSLTTSMTSVSTPDGLPEHYTVDFEVAVEGISVEIGFEVIGTNANWVAVDNFRLYYLSSEATELEDTDSDYKEGDEIDMLNFKGTVVGTNLFVNGGFNNGVYGWTAGNGYTDQLSASNVTFSQSGGYNDGPYVTLSATGAAGEATPTQAIAVEPGKSYLLVGYTKYSGSDDDLPNSRYSALFAMKSATAEASHYENGTSYSNDLVQLKIENTGKWVQTEGIFTVPAADADSTYYYVGMRMNWSTASYDGLQLYELDGAFTFPEDADYAEGDEITYDDVIYVVKTGVNLFTNGSFNERTTGWTYGNSYTNPLGASQVTYSTDGGYNGGPFITSKGGGSSADTTPSQAVAVASGKTYLFVGYTKGTAPGNGNEKYNGLMQMTDATTEANDDNKDPIEYVAMEWDKPDEALNGWTKTEKVFTASTAYAGVRFAWCPGASFDGMQLYELEELPSSVSWEMTAAGWGTLILPFDAEVPTGLTAYAGDALTLDEEESTITVGTAAEAIEANTPYLVKGPEGEYEFTGVPTNTADTYSLGMLVGTLVNMSLEDGDFTADSGQYVLQNHDGEVAFYPITSESEGVTLNAYHCYLTGVTGTALHLPGMATGIVAVEGAEAEANGAIYDLSGRKVSKAVKGVYIQNGKKVLVK